MNLWDIFPLLLGMHNIFRELYVPVHNLSSSTPCMRRYVHFILDLVQRNLSYLQMDHLVVPVRRYLYYWILWWSHCEDTSPSGSYGGLV